MVDAVGRIAAEEVTSGIDVPSFNNSAMDGFAVDATTVNQQLQNATEAKIHVVGQIQAGDKSEIDISEEGKNAWEIMTGAPVPAMFDAVIPIEQMKVEQHDESTVIIINQSVRSGQNVRMSGTDYQQGQKVISKHTVIHPQHVMALATVGAKQINVLKQIPVAIFSTGNELSERSSNELASGKIFNSNQPFLQSYLQDITCQPVFVSSCQDIEGQFEELLEDAKRHEVKIVFSTGAVSMGRYDFIPKVLEKKGAVIHFHKAKVRPGKPILFAELPDGTLYFGLPGNPIAAASGVRFFATPFIRKMQGLHEEPLVKAVLSQDVDKKQGFRTFAKARAWISESGQLKVDMLVGQGSFQTHSFAQSNCWLVLPEDAEHIKAGELVDLLPMAPGALTV